MFDLGRIADAVSGLISGGGAQQIAEASGVLDLLSHAGLDPSQLVGLSQEQIFDLLQQHGIDPSALDPGQIGELLQGAGLDQFAEAASSWLADGRR